MKITYQDTTTKELRHCEIVIENAVNVKINGIKIVEEGSGLRLSVDEVFQVCPNASNSITVKEILR